MWHTDYPHYVSAKAKIRTTLIPIILAETSILLTKTPNNIASLDFGYTTPGNRPTEYHIRATRKNEQVNVEMRTPLPQFANISLHASMTPKNADNIYSLVGNVHRNAEIYQVDGTVVLVANIPVDIQLKFTPRARNGLSTFTYELRETAGGYGKTFRLNMADAQDRFMQIAGGFSMHNQVNWQLMMAIVASDGILSKTPGLNRVDLNATIAPQIDGAIVGSFEFTSPWHHLGISSIKLETDLKLANSSGDVQASYELALIKGRSTCSWSWLLMQDMQITMDNIVFRAGTKPRLLKAGLRYIKDKTIDIGTLLNVDSVWSFATNVTILANAINEAMAEVSVQLPPPFGDVHIIDGRYKYEFGQLAAMHYEVNYMASETMRHISSRGQYTNNTNMEGNIRVDYGQGPKEYDDGVEINAVMLRKGVRREVSLACRTPRNTENSLAVNGSYDLKDIYMVFA